VHEKKIPCDDPRTACSAVLFRDFAFAALPVPATLSSPDLFAARRLAVLMPRLPLPPFPCLLAAMIAAIARQRMIRPEHPATALKQADTPSRSTRSSRALRTTSFALIFDKR